jgi:serine/threonine protein kinase
MPPLFTLFSKLYGQLSIIRKLGSGAYGTIYKATTSTNDPLCLKHIPGKDAVYEARIQTILSPHPNILPLLEVIQSSNGHYLVLPYANAGDLFTNMAHGKCTGSIAWEIIVQLVQAVKWCHDNNIAHMDIKPENVLLHQHRDGSVRVLLCDFGLATRLMHANTVYSRGSEAYIAPELLRANHRCKSGDLDAVDTKACDMWSLGILIGNLLTGMWPWKTAVVGDKNFEYYMQNGWRGLQALWKLDDDAIYGLRNLLAICPVYRWDILQVEDWVLEWDTCMGADVLDITDDDSIGGLDETSADSTATEWTMSDMNSAELCPMFFEQEGKDQVAPVLIVTNPEC